ncbi:hypothetical protein L4D76_22305 [Photobacterium sagamiensis]|uniref:hypothetical protein n=1 Tax=Photobacterium sagamiensis TaxID=2910241 RepID=UPI003D106679
MKIERLLAKFNIKGINYEPSQGGKGLLSLDEQLAVVGITWHKSPVGFLVLFVECLSDKSAAQQLYKATLVEAHKAMADWRGVYPIKALEALCITAMTEATQQQGRICPECNGSGEVIDKQRHSRKCQCCDDGRILWTTETRFALFCQTLPITYSRFKRYQPVLSKLVCWLTGQRGAAVLALQSRVVREEEVALEVA